MIDGVRRLIPVAGLVFAALLMLPIASRLASYPDRYPVRERLVDEPSLLRARTADLTYGGRRAGADQLQLRLRAARIREFASASELQLFMATYATTPTLIEGSLQIEGTSCRFITPPYSTLRDNTLLRFDARGACRRFDGFPTGDVVLDLYIEPGSGRAALWAFEHPEGPTPKLFALAGTLPLAIRGEAVRDSPEPTRTRINLLGYVWNVTPSVLWARLRTAAALVLAGVWLVLWRSGREHGGRWQVLRASAGAGLLMTGLGLSHAILFPPLQAPDEPDHLISLSEIVEDPAFGEQIKLLAHRTHFERIRHKSEFHFREIDVMRPWPVAWNEDIFSGPIAARSPLTVWWWRLFDAPRSGDATDRLWALRRADALLFGLMSGVAVALLAGTVPQLSAPALILALLAVPTLPFFGAHVSETALVVAVSLPLAAILAALVVDGRRTHWLGAPLGITVGLALLAGRKTWVLIPIAGLVLVARALTPGRPARGLRQIAVFWGTLTLALIGSLWAAQQAGMVDYAGELVRTRLPAALQPLGEAIAARVWLLALAPLPLALVEAAAAKVTWRPGAGPRIADVVAVVICAWLVLTLLSSFLIEYPSAPEVRPRGQTAAEYVSGVMQSMAVPFRIGHHDPNLSTLFWAGLGWVDTSPPEWIVNLVICATTAMTVWFLLRAARQRYGRVVRFVALLVGLVIALAASALGTFYLSYSLYGRYLVGWYLTFVMTVWTAPALSHRPWWPWLAAALVAHTYYLQLVPVRYF